MKLRSDLQVDDVLSVYSGRDGACCCGCSGNHRYNSKYRDIASKHRGYVVKDDEISDREIKRILNIIKKAEKIDEEYDYLATVVGKRLYIVYLKNKED